VNHRKPHKLGTPSTPSTSWLGRHVVPARCWFCGRTNKPSCSAFWSNRETRQFSGEPPKTPHARHSLTSLSIEPAKPFISGSQADYSVLPRSMTWTLPFTGSVFTTSSSFYCHRAARTWSRRLPGPSNQAYLSLTSSEATQAYTFHTCSSPAPRKSSRNLHQQYSAKSQSTPHCQSLITPRSDHPPVLGCSGPQMVRCLIASYRC
jgi:hypothetical protein